ncbi:hypothetical protein NQ318_020953 [Aromia moschata]|uniref:Reverse transcriptase domain-containing protein n=1 Tax=Aromia moschata TaxID=1265417 RepID=A0AAV8YMY0_9CUCU|nr:hypothetical protein NQ318_020953 [Aromia moschata]
MAESVFLLVEDLTDEDAGDEEYLNLNNLPGSQLLAPAEVMTKDTDVDEDAGNATAVGLNLNGSRKIVSAVHWDGEDDIPLSVFQAYNGEYFQQHVTAMGNSLSPFIANLFMSKFETEVKDKFEYFPRVWFRYVDDIFATLLGNSKDKIDYNERNIRNKL